MQGRSERSTFLWLNEGNCYGASLKSSTSIDFSDSALHFQKATNIITHIFYICVMRSRWPQAGGQDGHIYIGRVILCVEISKNAKKRKRPICKHLDRISVSNKGFSHFVSFCITGQMGQSRTGTIGPTCPLRNRLCSESRPNARFSAVWKLFPDDFMNVLVPNEDISDQQTLSEGNKFFSKKYV